MQPEGNSNKITSMRVAKNCNSLIVKTVNLCIIMSRKITSDLLKCREISNQHSTNSIQNSSIKMHFRNIFCRVEFTFNETLKKSFSCAKFMQQKNR